VQLATADEIAVVDTLRTDAKLLAPLLESEDAIKIVHDASFDVRLLRDAGVRMRGLFDTSVAARFLGEPATGLATLLSKYLGVTLKKEKQHADWGKRPIDSESLTYLENDVLHLEALAARLEAEVEEKGIALEVAEESRWVVSNAMTDVPDKRAPWVRIKGALDLTPPEQAILREVADVRERTAERLNVPPFKVVRNDVLIELVKKAPKNHDQALKIRGIESGRARKMVRDLVSAVKRGLAVNAPPREELPDKTGGLSREERDRRKKLIKAITKWRKKEAEARKVDPQVVLPGHCVGDIASRMPKDNVELTEVPGFGEFRVERYGEAITKLTKQTP
jgi:ribonuclease D